MGLSKLYVGLICKVWEIFVVLIANNFHLVDNLSNFKAFVVGIRLTAQISLRNNHKNNSGNLNNPKPKIQIPFRYTIVFSVILKVIQSNCMQCSLSPIDCVRVQWLNIYTEVTRFHKLSRLEIFKQFLVILSRLQTQSPQRKGNDFCMLKSWNYHGTRPIKTGLPSKILGLYFRLYTRYR